MAKRISRVKKTIVVAAAIAVAIGGAGAAYAYWTSTGEGDGQATTSTQTATFDIAPQGTPQGEISPDSLGQTVGFRVTNPGPGSLYLGGVTVTIADANGDPWVPADDLATASVCLLADYNVVITTPAPPGVLAALGTADGTVTVTLDNTGENQDDCQGQTVPLHYVADSVATP